ncbi:MAG: TonB-dependent receptor domain-containing protein [Vicinamibacterales bacterium]
MVTTDGEGRFQAPSLESGSYEVSAELSGFQTTVRDGLQLSIGQHLAITLTMQVGQLGERIVVTGASPPVETRRGGLSALVEERQIRDLPLNGRDFSQLTLLQPGIVASASTDRTLDRGMGTQVSVAGARPNQISYVLDGADVNFQGNQSPGSAAGGLLGVDTVREFQVLVNNYSAEYGRSAGGIVTAITRSGSNAYHGAGFEFFRNDALTSRNYFAAADQPKPTLDRNQYGGYVGGPLRKDKIFFFTSYEGLRQDRGLSLVARVPSRATRARTDISPAVRPYLLMYPEPNGAETGASGVYTATENEPTNEDFFVIKIDDSLTTNDTLSLRYSFDDASVVSPQTLPLFANNQHTQAHFFTGEYKRIISPTTLNVLRLSWNRPYEETVNVDIATFDPRLLFIPGTQFGLLGVSGLTNLGPDTGTPTLVDYKNLQLTNTFTWARGRHTVKTGINWTRWFNDQDSAFTRGGNYNFSSIDDFVRNIANTFEGTVPGSTTDRKWRQNLIGMFVQDDFALSTGLTLNLGARYEFITVPTEVGGRVAHMVNLSDAAPTPGNPLFKNPSLGNIAPRLGVAWDVFGDGKMSVRGGAGAFYEPILGNIYRAYGNRTPPYFQQANIRRPTFPDPFTGVVGVRNRLDLVQFDLQNPLRLQYNATVQRELLSGTVITAGYLGSRGYHQIRNLEANQATPQVLSDGQYFFPAGQTRPNSNFESIRIRTSDGNSWYNGLIVGLTKRFSHGLQMQASYTLGHATDEGSQSVGSGDFANSFQPRYGPDRHDNFGPSDFDVRHNFVFSYSYLLPEPASWTPTLRAVLGGWQVSGLVSLRSGIPFSPVLGFDRARALPRSGGAGQRPHWASGATAKSAILGGQQRYFDPEAFTLPEPGYFGNVQRNALTGPGYASWDAALFKNVPVGKKYRAQIRIEAFNILNRANFGLPEATVFNSAGRAENAGEISTILGTPRLIQLGIKVEF